MKNLGKVLSLAAIGVSLVAGSAFYTTSAEAACVVGVRSNDVLNMRSYGSTRAAIVGVLRPGACGVTIRQRSGRWGLIRHRGSGQQRGCCRRRDQGFEHFSHGCLLPYVCCF